MVGYGLVDVEGSRLRLVAAGTFQPPAKAPLEQRLAHIAGELGKLIRTHRPDAVSVEDVFVRSDPRAALAIGHARGAILSVVGARDLPVSSYPPASVKRAVAGNGRAGKEQVARMVSAILALERPPEPLDATDALATAIAHALALRTQTITGQ